MQIKHYETLDETVVHHQCDNGLEVIFVLKPGFNKKFVSYTTKYGSLDDHFIVNGEEVRVPDGIAHFLEHKMFEKEDGDVFTQFGQNGANANAYTSYDRTSYIFSTTTELYANLKTLMNMVEQPYFTAETVEKEVGIIDEELKMYLDDPDYRSYMELLKSMYQDSPLRVDIGGTSESIKQITHEHLYMCHETFYHPSNMVITIVGDLDYEEAIQFIEDHQNARGMDNNHTIERIVPTEQRQIVRPYTELRLDVNTTKVKIGYKGESDSLSPRERMKKDLSMLLALDIVFGEQSNYFYELQDKGLVDDSFNFAHSEEASFSFTMFAVNTNDDESFVQAIDDIITRVKDTQFFTDEQLMLKKREIIGDYLSSLNSPEYISSQYTKYYIDGMNLYELLDVIDEITVEDLATLFGTMLDKQYQSVSVVKPNV